MNQRLENNIFSKINELEDRVNGLDKKLDKMNESFQEALKVLQTHLLRVKNGEALADDFVLGRRPYNDLSPDKAWSIYQDKDQDFILLDVSVKTFAPESELPEVIKIPLEELNYRYSEIVNKAASLMVISEDGTRSILACEMLNRKGYFNINNVSGGYKFWRGFREQGQSNASEDLQSA